MPYARFWGTKDGGYLTRSLYLSNIKDQGYPMYLATFENDPASVRTILYYDIDNPDINKRGIFLDEKKTFKISSMGDKLIFTSNPDAPGAPVDAIALEWEKIWANQGNSNGLRTGLLIPNYNVGDVINYIIDEGIQFRITGFLLDGTHIGYANLSQDRFIWKMDYQNASKFKMTKSGSLYNLINTDKKMDIIDIAYANPAQVVPFSITRIIQGAEGEKIYPYVSCWSIYNACRWVQDARKTNAITFSLEHIDGNKFRMMNDNKYLSYGDWYIAFYGNENYGIEFNDFGLQVVMGIELVMNQDNQPLSDVQKYMINDLLPIYVNETIQKQPNWKPSAITDNLPGPNIKSCVDQYWDGVTLSCYLENIPYTKDMGDLLCNSLDDFSNDIHCQAWAIENKNIKSGVNVESKLKSVCKDANITNSKEMSICSCYLPDSVYEDAIKQRYKTQKDNLPIILDAIKFTNNLECQSGLCKADANLSAKVYFQEGRTCVPCIQVAGINLVNSTTGEINLNQECTLADIKYTWNELIQKLIQQGAYKIPIGGKNKNVIINQAGNSIKLMLTEPKAKQYIIRSAILNTTPRSMDGNIVIDEKQWSKNKAGYSNSILGFLFATE